MQMVAYFLRKFPGYTLADLMNEYAISVYALVRSSIQLDASATLEQATVTLLPNSDEEHIDKFFDNYKKVLGLEESTGNDYDKLITMLGG